jgi:hypothetical protein
VSYTTIAGFFSGPNETGVSDCAISRIGTRMSVAIRRRISCARPAAARSAALSTCASRA